MKVCSLIDKIPEKEEALPPTPMNHRSGEVFSTQPAPPKALASSEPLLPPPPPPNQPDAESKHMADSRLSPGSMSHASGAGAFSKSPDMHQDQPNQRFVPEPVAMSLLGPAVRGYLMTAPMFEEALRLRAEQEKSEQERLKLEAISRTRALLEYAVDNKIPPEVLTGLHQNSLTSGKSSMIPQPRPPGEKYLNPGELKANAPPETSSGPYQRSPYPVASPLQRSRQYENSNNASSVDPMNFRFGGVPSFNHQPPANANRRPRSPAKLGAIAVANLANPLTPYRPANRTVPLHQRHYSMPIETSFAGQRPGERQFLRGRNQQSSQATEAMRSPEHLSMQVRPMPAQPLHKQSKRGNSFSQDSMTSHQQVIQFHHWISENPGERSSERNEHKRNDSASSQSSVSMSHKRRKSTDSFIGE
ncbi:hypothetical protein OXX59_004273 [Metschnikowia pulcherrima]